MNMNNTRLEKLIAEGANIIFFVEGVLRGLEVHNQPKFSTDAYEAQDKYNNWRINIKNFLEDSKLPLSKTALLRLPDSIPYMPVNVDYRWVNGPKALKLMSNIKREVNEKIKKLSTLAEVESVEKPHIFISKKEGIYEMEGRVYPISDGRSKLIHAFIDKEILSGPELEKLLKNNSNYVNKSIREINKNFHKLVKATSEKLIIRYPTGGYALNTKYFTIEFID